MAKVLVVEDDPQIRAALAAALDESGHETAVASDGASALAKVVQEPPDLVLLDLGLPDVDGSTLLTMIRSIGDTYVIAVTARSEPEEIIRVLNLGADDYVTKPFDFNQLGARIKAVLRRSSAERRHEQPAVLIAGGLSLFPLTRSLKLDGRPIALRHLEYELLLTLASAEGQLVPVEALVRRLWGADLDLSEGTSRLYVQLSLLRTKLGESARKPRYLHRVRNLGIRLTPPTDR